MTRVGEASARRGGGELKVVVGEPLATWVWGGAVGVRFERRGRPPHGQEIPRSRFATNSGARERRGRRRIRCAKRRGGLRSARLAAPPWRRTCASRVAHGRCPRSCAAASRGELSHPAARRFSGGTPLAPCGRSLAGAQAPRGDRRGQR